MTQEPSIKLDTPRHRVIVDTVPRGKKGTRAAEFHYPISVVVVGHRAYVVDSWNHRVQVFDLPDWKFAFEFGGFFCPKWIVAVEDEGKQLLLVVDTNNRRLTFHEPSGMQVAEFATTYRRFPVMATNLTTPVVAGFSPRSSQVVEISYEDGFTESFELAKLLHPDWWSTKLQKPISLVRDLRGLIYVSDFGRRVVEKFDADGNFIAKILGPDVLKVPGKMAMNADDLLVTDRPANAVHIYSTATGDYRRWDYPFPAPGVIGRDPAGNIWVGEYKPEPDANGSTLYVFGSNYDFIRTVRLAESQQPTALAVVHGHVFVADQAARNVLIFDSNGNFLQTLRPEPYSAPVWALTLDNGHISVGSGPVVDLLWSPDGSRLYCIDFESATVTVKNWTR